MPSGGLVVRSFDEQALQQLLGRARPTIKYLFEYLTDLGAKAIAVENHYVDRHYLDDFARYYALSFNAPPAHCRRLHFFSLETPALDALFARACLGTTERNEVEQLLAPRAHDMGESPYLGFVVRRPLADAALGRTVLRTYPADGGRRHYTVVRDYHVHILGMVLRVEGLAYQQQDRGAAVCASTALWSAIQRVAVVAGHRTPTPSEITVVAGSPFPAAHGLDWPQMARAIAELGYTADAFAPGENLPLFRAKLIATIQSQLPVILILEKGLEGHAVCVTGFSEPGGPVSVPLSGGGTTIQMRSASANVLYVHDDNLGSHAHYELFDMTTPPPTAMTAGGSAVAGTPIRNVQMLRRARSNKPAPPWWPGDVWQVSGALVPKPEEMRLSIDALFGTMLEVRAVAETLVFKGIKVEYSVRFVQGARYKREIIDWRFSPADLQGFYATASLPRHVGVISIDDDQGRRLVDLLIDASEVERIAQVPAILAIVAPGVPGNSIAGTLLLQLAAELARQYNFLGGTGAVPPAAVLLAT